jgi:arginyl-tRNA synthetase
MIKKILENKVKRAISALYPDADMSGVKVERSGDFGDYATNAALVLAGVLDRSSRDIAEEVKGQIFASSDGQYMKSLEIAGPGFLNITLTDEAILSNVGVLSQALSSGFDFVAGQKINIEFIMGAARFTEMCFQMCFPSVVQILSVSFTSTTLVRATK